MIRSSHSVVHCPGLVWEQHPNADPGADTSLQPLPVHAQLQLQERKQREAPLPPCDGHQHAPGGEAGVTGQEA